MDQSIFDQEIFLWVAGVVIGLPLAVVILGEVAERLERAGNPLAQTVRHLRHFIAPLLVLLLILQPILRLTGESSRVVQLVQTLFWLTVIWLGLTFLKNLFELVTLNPSSWLATIPRLFFALGRALIIGGIGFYLLSAIWHIDLSNIATALGIGSLVIALALQETLSNLVSGFLLVADNPFKVGDLIEVRKDWMIVQDVTWRSTRCISDYDNSIVHIPNGVLGNEILKNHGSPATSIHYRRHPVNFSYNDPPNQVSEVLLEVLRGVEYVHDKPEPIVLVKSYGDGFITYEMRYYINIFNWTYAVNLINSWVYYAARRNGLTLMYPILQMIDEQEKIWVQPTYSRDEILTRLESLSIFASLDKATLDNVVRSATIAHYGMRERIVRQGEPDAGFYILQRGGVVLTVKDPTGGEHELARLIPGEFFGETALLRGEFSAVSVTTTTDSEVFIIGHELMNQLIREDPRFALEMDTFIQQRKKDIAAILQTDASQPRNGSTPINLA